MSETTIVINGVTLSKAQKMTLEMALSCFIMDMKANVFEDADLSKSYLKHASYLDNMVRNSKNIKTNIIR